MQKLWTATITFRRVVPDFYHIKNSQIVTLQKSLMSYSRIIPVSFPVGTDVDPRKRERGVRGIPSILWSRLLPKDGVNKVFFTSSAFIIIHIWCNVCFLYRRLSQWIEWKDILHRNKTLYFQGKSLAGRLTLCFVQLPHQLLQGWNEPQQQQE